MSESTPDNAPITTVMDEGDIGRTIARIAHQIIEKTHIGSPQSPRVVLLGIPSGGVPLARRLGAKISEFTSVDIPTGAVDITLYRDDLGRGPHRALQGTHIPACGIDGATVIIVDDVLFSGRTVRAALDAIADIGRPEQIQLAVLVDRGHRQLPIRADYVGKNLPTARSEDVTVKIADIDGVDAVTLTRRQAAATSQNSDER